MKIKQKLSKFVCNIFGKIFVNEQVESTCATVPADDLLGQIDLSDDEAFREAILGLNDLTFVIDLLEKRKACVDALHYANDLVWVFDLVRDKMYGDYQRAKEETNLLTNLPDDLERR